MTKEELDKHIIDKHPDAEIIHGKPVTEFIHQYGFDTTLEIVSSYAELVSEDEENWFPCRENYARLHLELKQLLERMDFNFLQEERERNVPANWEELVAICERIKNKQIENVGSGEVDVSKYGVIEYTVKDIEGDRDVNGKYLTNSGSYGLQEYIDEFKDDWLPEDEEK